MHHVLIPPTYSMELESSKTIFEKHSIVTGHHVYKVIPTIEEVLHLGAEGGSQHDKYTGAILKSDQIVGHVPRCMS